MPDARYAQGNPAGDGNRPRRRSIIGNAHHAVWRNFEESSMHRLLPIAVGLACAVAASDCRAQEQQSFKALIGKGFEIKSVTFAHGESTDNRDSVIVTLQNGKSVAVCFFAAVNWINLSTNALEDGKRCDVR
jgi:hypothetical protein